MTTRSAETVCPIMPAYHSHGLLHTNWILNQYLLLTSDSKTGLKSPRMARGVCPRGSCSSIAAQKGFWSGRQCSQNKGTLSFWVDSLVLSKYLVRRDTASLGNLHGPFVNFWILTSPKTRLFFFSGHFEKVFLSLFKAACACVCVFVCECVGDCVYLRTQIQQLPPHLSSI